MPKLKLPKLIKDQMKPKKRKVMQADELPEKFKKFAGKTRKELALPGIMPNIAAAQHVERTKAKPKKKK